MQKNVAIPETIFDTSLQGKVIYIRHGQTNLNLNMPKIGRNGFYLPEYLNDSLSEHGIEETLKAAKQYENLNIEVGYVSPLYRALQTATLLFKNHPNRSKIVFIVHPLLTEIATSAYDFAFDIQKEKEIFNMESIVKIDWSLFDKFYKNKKAQEFYYLDYIDNLTKEQKKEEFAKLYRKFNTPEIKEALCKFAAFPQRNGFKTLESLKHLWLRFMIFKELLKAKYSSECLKNKEKKIIIVAHSALAKIGTSKRAFHMDKIDDYPEDCYNMTNCQGISLYL